MKKSKSGFTIIRARGTVTRSSIKSSYDWLKNIETILPSESASKPAKQMPISELIIEGFDEEQLWQELELQNNFKLGRIRKSLRTTIANSVPLNLLKRDANVQSDSMQLSVNSVENGLNENENEEPESFGDGIINYYDRKSQYGEPDSEDEIIDHFEDIPSDEDEETGQVKYSSFFDLPNDKRDKPKRNSKAVRFEDDGSDSSDFGENDLDEEDEMEINDGEKSEKSDIDQEMELSKSKLEVRNSALQSKISELEEQNLAPKSWQMAGEVMGKERPQNALLEEHLGYETATRTAPVVTEDFTEKLENMIRQRIKDKAWDDVERKEKPKEDPKAYRNELTLNQEKSKISLSQVYEEEFLKQAKKEKVEASNPKHLEIKKDMKDLFDKLDALSNYHYAPKPPQPELKIVKNVRSLQMEEVAPVSVADATLLAAEEVKTPTVGELKHDSEKDKTDKNRERRKKKDLKRKKNILHQQKEAKNVVPKDKLKALEKIGRVKKAKASEQGRKSVKSSEFFNKMQQEVSETIKSASKSSQPVLRKQKTSGASQYKL